MASPLDDIEYLVRSKHRSHILRELSEQPCKRTVLQEETDVSRTTISRSLSKMEEKGWIVSEGWEYELTPLGEMMHEMLSQSIETTASVQDLNQVIQWFPIEEMDIDLHQFCGATVSVASRNDPTLPAREFGKLRNKGNHLRILAHAFDPLQYAVGGELDESDQSLEFVFSENLYTKLQENPDAIRHVNEILEKERVEFYLAEEEPAVQLVVIEDTVGILLSGDDGTFPGYIESQEESIVDWAIEKFKSHQENATRITADNISAEVRENQK